MPLIYLVAGEHSGDVLGSRLMQRLAVRRPDLAFAGIGGPRMAQAGLDPLFPMQDLAVMGLVEILPRLRLLRRRLQQTVADIGARRPALVVTIDTPGFSLRLLDAIRALPLRRVHYVAPQVWAWREHRVRRFPGLWDRLLCLLPFEPAFFARHGLPAHFVGHPVLESGAETGDGDRFRARHGIAAGSPVLTLMPGSRRSEAPRLLPVLGETVRRLERDFPGCTPVIPAAAAVAELVRNAGRTWPVPPRIVTDLADKHDAFAASAAALTKSGTSTLELALAGVPMAVTYRTNPITAAIARRLIRLPHVAMVNILAGREVVPELLQEQCNPAALAAAVAALLDPVGSAAAQKRAFPDILAGLRPPVGLPSEAAAGAVLDLLQ